MTTYSARFTRSVCGCPRGKHVSERCPWSGSSPRARGTPQATWRLTGDKRFIPAGAGNTKNGSAHVSPMSVHPRGCGEHATSSVRRSRQFGSSPRARGTPPVPGRCRVNLRFIPAGAGNTGSNARGSVAASVHPRGREEHLVNLLLFSVLGGSSPRARGTLHVRRRGGRGNRFIPAGAGNTLHGPGQKIGRIRFIPAGAGNTLYSSARSSSMTVHPRGRGEHTARISQGAAHSGSSPRARGTHLAYEILRLSFRFILAGAGNTASI